VNQIMLCRLSMQRSYVVAPNPALAPGRRDGTLEMQWRGSPGCPLWRKGALAPQGTATPRAFRVVLARPESTGRDPAAVAASL
jgi:hypothetical protein